MHGDSFQQALTDLSTLIIPLGPELGGPPVAVTAANIAATVKPFLILFALNFFSFSMLYYFGKLAFRSCEEALSAFAKVLCLLAPTLSTRSAKAKLRAKLREHHRRRPSRVIENEDTFQSWERFAKGTVFSIYRGNLTSEARRALNVLGVHAFATETEVRKAYLELMKKYHPDRFWHEPLEFERAQDVAVQIREAYDTIAKQFYQVQ